MRIAQMTSNGTRDLRDANEPQSPARAVIVEKELSPAIIGCFFDVYNELGYGFVESLYARALELAFRAKGLQVDREYPVTVTFRGQQIGFHRVDMFVERRVILELKSTERLSDTARRQLRSYVTGLGLNLGMLLHFGPMPRFYRVLPGWKPRDHGTSDRPRGAVTYGGSAELHE
jgi:GxxExxY protein